MVKRMTPISKICNLSSEKITKTQVRGPQERSEEEYHENFFRQYVPSRDESTQPNFTVIWVAKVHTMRRVPRAVKAEPPLLSTEILFVNNEQMLLQIHMGCLRACLEVQLSPTSGTTHGGTGAQHGEGNVNCAQVWTLTGPTSIPPRTSSDAWCRGGRG